MVFYNVQSIFVFFSLISLIGGLVALFKFKQLDTSARYWVAAALVMAATNSSTLFRTALPLLLSYSIAIGLSCAMFVVMGLGMARLYNKGPQAPALWGTLALTVVYILALEWSRLNAPAHVTLVLSSLGFALTSLWCAIPAHRHYRLSGNLFSMHMRWVVIALGLIQFTRLHNLLGDEWSVQNLDQSHLNLVIWTFIYILSILRYCLYVAIRIQEKADEGVQAAAAHARNEERRRTAEQLAQLGRQHSLGIMAASVSHELNQPLTATLNYAELAKSQLQSGHTDSALLVQLMDYIAEHTLRASQIIRQFRQFIKPAEGGSQRIDVNNMLAEVCELLDLEIRHHHVRVRPALNGSAVFVQGKPILLSQVLVNLMLNAIQAMERSTTRELHLAIQTDRHNVSILVRDTGKGLPEDYSGRIGEPFYTTKAQGLGLGISICQHILAQYGGHLILENQSPQGVCATVILPKAA
ncbi:MAG: sensor histidine kinase [Limnohabitans sp.]